MYSSTQFKDHQMMAFSVPPSVHADLSDGFKELSRIHFYLGRVPIDFMVEAVESASLEDIAKGKTQIYFASKEIQEFISKSLSSADALSNNALDPSLYFQKTFNNTLQHTLEILEKAYKKPTKKANLEIIETMLGLTQEIIFLNKELTKIGVVTDIAKDIENIQTQYSKIYNLKSHYENIVPLKEFNDYQQNAETSVINQLKIPYEFNYSELAKKVYFSMNDWMPTLRYLDDEKEKMNQPGYIFNMQESQELKDNFVRQFKSFNQLLNNGVVNYVNSFSASISEEIFTNVQKSQVSAEAYFERSISYHERSLKNNYSDKDYDKEQIKKLQSNKEAFIQQKIDDKVFYEKHLTVLHRQEKNISQSFDKIRANLFNVSLKDTVTFEGDITTGFVVGTFSNAEKILLIHKDNFVNVPEAVYAMVLNKNKYEDLVKKNQLVFTEEFRESEFSTSSNFWSYGQLLQEISDPTTQKFFLGQEFDLIDKTELTMKETKKKPKI